MFSIVGNSSKLDQDDGDFDDDFDGGKAYQIEEQTAKSHILRPDSYTNEVSSDEDKNTNSYINAAMRRSRTLSIPKNKRYSKEWSQVHTLGFAYATVTRKSFKLTFIEVYADGGFRESKSVEL